MSAYVTYSFYTDTYGGNAVDETEFTRLALQASSRIDQLTFDRVASIVEAGTQTSLIEKIKLAVCAVVDEIQKWTSIGEFGRVKSESVGQHSVTYMDDPTTFGDGTRQAAKIYLGTSGLMFPGFDLTTEPNYEN
jgi:hypothetical protein